MLVTRKKNHCVFPLEFVSFAKSKLYSFGPNFTARDKFPLSKRDSKMRVESRPVEAVYKGGKESDISTGLSTRFLTSHIFELNTLFFLTVGSRLYTRAGSVSRNKDFSFTLQSYGGLIMY